MEFFFRSFNEMEMFSTPTKYPISPRGENQKQVKYKRADDQHRPAGLDPWLMHNIALP